MQTIVLRSQTYLSFYSFSHVAKRGQLHLKAALLLSCLLFSGCSDVLLSRTEKFNRAFPPNADLRAAIETHRDFIRADATTQNEFKHKLNSLMQTRDITCGYQLAIGLFDSVEKISSMPINRHCLNTVDAELSKKVAFQSIGFRLNQPPIIPKTSLGEAKPIQTDAPFRGSEIYAARDANLAILRGDSNSYSAVEIPSGRVLSTFNHQFGSSQRKFLSPNGRVLAINSTDASITYLDIESGAVIYQDKGSGYFVAWLENSSGALINTRERKLASIEFNLNIYNIHHSWTRYIEWAYTLSGSLNKLLLSDRKALYLATYETTNEGLQISILSELNAQESTTLLQLPPMLLNDGTKMAARTLNGLGIVDLDGGSELLFNLSPYHTHGVAQLNDHQLLVSIFDKESHKNQIWIIDINSQKIQLTDFDVERTSSLSGLIGRIGYILSGRSTILIGDSVGTSGKPTDINEFTSQLNMEWQIQKLETDAERREAASRSISTESAIQSPPSKPILENLPANAVIEAVGVYRGRETSQRERNQTISSKMEKNPVEITVHGPKPVVLVLTSYEPVKWNIKLTSNAKLSAVLLSSYYPAEVTGAESVPIKIIGSKSLYERTDINYASVDQEVQRWTGKKIGSFQGSYQGSHFQVGLSPP